MGFTHRVARSEDIPALEAVMNAAITELQADFLSAEQVESSRAIMGIDTQLVSDETYYVVIDGEAVAGCGGWSRRATLYGGDHTSCRDAEFLEPTVDAARVRAMYTHPSYARRGVGRLILDLCERAASAEGFRRIELMATTAGEPLYRAYGFAPIERVSDDRGGATVPLIRMAKPVVIK